MTRKDEARNDNWSVIKKPLTQWGWWAVGFAAGLIGFLIYIRFSSG